MVTSNHGTISARKWLLVVLIHALGYTLVYGFSVAPIFFAYTGEYTSQSLRALPAALCSEVLNWIKMLGG